MFIYLIILNHCWPTVIDALWTALLPTAGVPLVCHAGGGCEEGMQAAIPRQGEAAGFPGCINRFSEPLPSSIGKGP